VAEHLTEEGAGVLVVGNLQMVVHLQYTEKVRKAFFEENSLKVEVAQQPTCWPS